MKLSLPLNKNDKAERKTEKQKVEERREEVLSRGKKFKYPLQYAKHRLVINTLIVAFVAIVVLITAGWAALYKFGDMGDIMYRISYVVPVPVAKVDGKSVRFSDYLMAARSSLTTLEQQSGLENNAEDKAAMTAQYKRSALTRAEDLTYALKLGEELGLEVPDEEIQAAFDEHRRVGGADRSEESFLKVLSTNFGLSKREYQRMLYLALMRAKVEQAIDSEANRLADSVEAKLASSGGDFGAVRDEFGDKVVYENTGGLIDNKNVDSGRSGAASSLAVGERTGKILSSNGDGYYFVKLLGKNETQVHYESLYIRFTEFDRRLAELRASDKIKEYISLEEISQTNE